MNRCLNVQSLFMYETHLSHQIVFYYSSFSVNFTMINSQQPVWVYVYFLFLTLLFKKKITVFSVKKKKKTKENIYLVFLNTLITSSWRVCVSGQFNNCSIFHSVTVVPLCLSRLYYVAFKFLFSKGDWSNCSTTTVWKGTCTLHWTQQSSAYLSV